MSDLSSPGNEEDVNELLRRAATHLGESRSYDTPEEASAMMALSHWFGRLATEEPHILRWQYGQALGIARTLLADSAVLPTAKAGGFPPQTPSR